MTTTHFSPPIGRVTAAVIALALASAALAATPAMAARTYTLSVSSPKTLTLPAGDGFNDRTAVTLRSNGAISATVALYDSGRHLVKTIAEKATLVRSGSDYRARVSFALADLEAGRYSIRATRTVGSSLVDVATLSVGSGRPTAVSVTPTATTVFPHEDGYLDSVRSTITARDETGTALPVSGTAHVYSSRDSVSRHFTRPAGSNSAVALDIAGFTTGRARLKASVSGPAGPARESRPVIVTLRSTRVTKVTVSSDASTIYPAADGYRDSATISASTSSSTGRKLDITGSVAITRGGVTVKKWKRTSSGASEYRWNGRVKNRIVPGNYVVTTRATGPEGTTKKSATRISVSAKKLHTETLTYVRDASGILTSVQSFDRARRGDCNVIGGAVACTGFAVDSDYHWSLSTWGSEPVPAVVRNSYTYRSPSIRVWTKTASLTGKSEWSFGGVKGHRGNLLAGTHALSWLPLNQYPAKTDISVSLRARARATILQLRFDYHYAVLK